MHKRDQEGTPRLRLHPEDTRGISEGYLYIYILHNTKLTHEWIEGMKVTKKVYLGLDGQVLEGDQICLGDKLFARSNELEPLKDVSE